MKKLVTLVAAAAIYMLFPFLYVRAENNSDTYLGVKDVQVGGQWFLSYLSGGLDGEPTVNEFVIRRGYINVYKTFSRNLIGRITPDVSVDHEGDGLGDVELRLKYAYLTVKLNNRGFFQQPYFEFGLVHRPWLDYEQHINQYRCQGTMYLDRVKVYNSADFGLTFMTLLGAELDGEYQKNVSEAFPGSYGSFAIGVYNGGGYHAMEMNNNKSIEARLSLRPLHRTVPGLQLHYNGAWGKGNTEVAPDWILNSGMISYETMQFVLTAQFHIGVGNSYGHYIDENNLAKSHHGYSVFGEYKMHSRHLSLFGRYDYWHGKSSKEITHRAIIGIAYHFYGRNKLLFDYDVLRDEMADKVTTGMFEVAFEVRF
jgi:hypothetical protein